MSNISNEIYKFFYLKELKCYQPFLGCVDFLSKIDFIFLLWLIIFEPLEPNQSNVPHLNVLICGIYASCAQGLSSSKVDTFASKQLLVHSFIFRLHVDVYFEKDLHIIFYFWKFLFSEGSKYFNF